MAEHCCDICGKIGPWSDDWSWWGSYADLDEGCIIKFCSATCQSSLSLADALRRQADKYRARHLKPPKLSRATLESALEFAP